MTTPKCTCPTKFDEHTRAVVRAGLDQFCPVHGAKQQELPHCRTCTCGQHAEPQAVAAPPQRLAIDLCNHDSYFATFDASGQRVCLGCGEPV